MRKAAYAAPKLSAAVSSIANFARKKNSTATPKLTGTKIFSSDLDFGFSLLLAKKSVTKSVF